MTTCDDERCPILTPHRHEPAMTEPRPGVDLATSTSDVDLAPILHRFEQLSSDQATLVTELFNYVDRLRADLAAALAVVDAVTHAFQPRKFNPQTCGADYDERHARTCLREPDHPVHMTRAALSAGGTDRTERDQR